MIVCSNCLHHNPDEAGYCEACGVQLPDAISCTNCGSPVQNNAHFCGQCGFNLRLSQRAVAVDAKGTSSDGLLPEPPAPEPIMMTYAEPDSLIAEPNPLSKLEQAPKIAMSEPTSESASEAENLEADTPNTQIQTQSAALLHVQSNTLMGLKDYPKVVHIGKPNDRIPPDINVGVLPNAEVVSRVHAAIHLEGDQCFVEDMGSANGTYVNNLPLMPRAKQQLRVGDRISLGKGDLVTFIFQMS
jgi:predicted component of type VI protein secretion system